MALLRAVTRYGVVKGVMGNNPGNTVFKGVAFAKPPVGKLRFAPPVEPDSWPGELLCDKWPKIPCQVFRAPEFYKKEFYPVERETSEDCLYLNIWTPAESPAAGLPVMFWIHGGGFAGGYSYEMEFDGEAINKRGVILVSTAYRVGPLGFFAHPGLSARSAGHRSGNYGLLDQIMALQWVKENIAAFGGDPANVTVFGQSAGGMSVRCLLTSPLSRGLFRHAIIQSGGGISDVGGLLTVAEMEELGKQVTNDLGWTVADLYEKPALEIYEKITAVAAKHARPEDMVLPMHPVVDGYVLLDNTGNSVIKGDIVPGVSIMCGTVAGDVGLFARHVREKEPHAAEKKRVLSFSPSVVWGKYHVRTGRQPIYGYFFDRNLPGDNLGAYHSAELWYVFGTLDRCWRTFTGYDYDLSRAMLDYWTNFAKHGNPGGPGVREWPPYTAETPVTMCFSDGGYGPRDLVNSELAVGIIEDVISKSGISP